MKRKCIQVVITEVSQYVPDLTDHAYVEGGADTIEKAMELDKMDIEGRKISLEELRSIFNRPTTTYDWKIVELDE